MNYGTEEFKEVFNLLNKRGKLDKRILCDIKGYEEYIERLRCLRERKKKAKDKYERNDFDNEIKEENKHFDVSVDDYLKDLTRNIYQFHELELTCHEIDNVRIYTTKPRLSSLIILSTLNRDLRRCYKIHPANRNAIMKTVKALVKESHPLTILRLDIKSFYESICLDNLIEKIEDDSLLHDENIHILNIIKKECKELNCTGVPRGVSCSAFLSELYMRDIDNRIKELEGVYYYQRYVDDIIIFATPKIVGNGSVLYDKISKLVMKYGLELHTKEESRKTAIIDNSTAFAFDYLGYRIEKTNDGTCKFSISENKIEKIEYEMLKAITDFKKDIHSKKRLFGMTALNFLLLRIKKLTSNYRLTGNKHDVMTGIYFRYPLLTDINQLVSLDEKLKAEVYSIKAEDIPPRMGHYSTKETFNQQETAEHIYRACLKYSFRKGFTEKRNVGISKKGFNACSKAK